jgi:D-beta-D-heptose 7-phosphate kinase/D-beta-D-heptose 1-phosphate adenosyltransferase
MDVVILSGGFDPVHDGHISMFRHAALKYDKVLVGLNSDKWLIRKKGAAFMPYDVRKTILESIKYIDCVYSFDDSDDTAIELIDVMNTCWSDVASSITFGNGGDRKEGNYPELHFCRDMNIAIDDSIGGSDKVNSSSDFLANWRYKPTKRDWGIYEVLSDYKTTKVKELIVNPQSQLSWQTHEERSELWFVREGKGLVYYSTDTDGKQVEKKTLCKNDYFIIPKGRWHQLVNETKELLSIIEIQYGTSCVESDILRGSRPHTD